MRIMTTTKVPVYVSLAVAGIMALSACGSNSSNDASNSSPSSSSSTTASKTASAGGSGTVNSGGGTSANSGSGANGGAANSGAEGGTGTGQNSGTGAQSGSVTGADANGGAQANQGAEAQGGAQQQQADPGGANAANDEHNVTKNPNALTPGEYVIHREASWDYVDTTGSRYHVDGDGGWTSVGEDGTSTVAADGSWTKNYADGHTVARVEADGTYRVTYDGQLSPEMPSNAVPVSPGKLPDPKAVPAVNPVQPTKPGM